MKNPIAVYRGRTRMVPGSLNLVRSHKGPQLILTVDSAEAGRQLFVVPMQTSMPDAKTILFEVLGDFVIEAKQYVTFDAIRLSLFVDGEYRQALTLNGEKIVGGIALAPGSTLTIRADKQWGTQITDYIKVLEAPNVPIG